MAATEIKTDSSVVVHNRTLYDWITYAEYAFLPVSFLADLTKLRLAVDHTNIPFRLCTAAVCLILLALLAPLKPLHWKRSNRILLCCANCILVSIALWCGVARLTQPLYIIVVAKATCLLSMRPICALLASAWLCQFGLECYKLREQQYPIETAIFAACLLTITPLFLMIVCALTVSALDREHRSRCEAERLAKEVESLAKELERKRITQEIHDVIGHSLTSLRIQLEVASRYASLDDAEARQSINHAKELASNALQEIRTILRSIREKNIDLTKAVTDLIKETNSTKTILVDGEVDAGTVSPGIALEVFRIVQECLTNIKKHANADRAEVKISRENGALHVQVSDNGKGLSKEDVKGLGLEGILARIDQLGGEVELKNSESGGATMRAIIPLGEP